MRVLGKDPTRMTDRLPIYEIEREIVECVRNRRRLVVQAPTGSGKSTQVPQMLLNHGCLEQGQVVVLQPRRLAARLLAARVAGECGSDLGRLVGYQIRFDNVSGRDTKIKYVTEGVLLRQMLGDPELRGVQAVIFDEFHERHLYGDITLAQALELQERRRPDLAVILMSATIQTGVLQSYLAPCTVLNSEGRTFPVEIQFSERASGNLPVWEQAAEAFAGHMRSGGQGDTLVFMPGGYEIQQTIRAIGNCPESKGHALLPLHGELPVGDQDAAIRRYDRPKVVVSTNVAETSLTIDGIRLVIDSGLARIPKYDPNRGINTLLVERISRASADQRAGRAGRTAPGTCVRLWTSQEHIERPMQELPEVKRLDLSEVVLTLKAAGVPDLRSFRWLEPPNEPSLVHAEEMLVDLGALKRQSAGSNAILMSPVSESPPTSVEAAVPIEGNAGVGLHITELGRRMLAFPLHPRYSRMLLAAEDFGCVESACLIAALTQGRDLLIRNPGRDVEACRESLFGDQAASDFWIQMRAWDYAAENQFRMEACRKAGIHSVTARQVGALFDQFLNIARREGLRSGKKPVSDEALQKCILIGFSDRVAHRLDQGTLRCELTHGRRGVLARESVVQKAALFVAAEIREIDGRDRTVNTLLSLATAIEARWLEDLFPEDKTEQLRVFYDASIRRVCAEALVMFRDLALDKRRVEPPPADAAARLLAEEVVAGRLVLGGWNHAVDQWILRLNLLSRWCPEFELPALDQEDRRHLTEQICHGAFSYKDIKEKPVVGVVKSWLSGPQHALLDKHAPERLTLRNGRTPKLVYVADGSPYIALRIQELYEVTETPSVAMGRTPVLVHILAPNMRPVQITQDMAGFWREHYPRLKQELQRKYPKHEWR